jgi:predicted small secreted protein
MIRFTLRKPLVFVAILVIAAAVLAACSSAGEDTQSGATGSSPAPDPSLHVFTTDTDFDSSYRITMHLLDGYAGDQGGVVVGTDDGQGISAWTVGSVYAEPCKWPARCSTHRSIHRSMVSSLA